MKKTTFSYIIIRNDRVVEIYRHFNNLDTSRMMSIIAEQLNRSSDCFYTECCKTSIPNVRYISGEDYVEQINNSKIMKKLTNNKVDYNVAIYRVSFLNKDKLVSLKQRDIDKIAYIALDNDYEVRFVGHE